MLELTNKDKTIVDNAYIDLLKNLKDIMINNNKITPLECYYIIVNMLRNGNFSKDRKINFDTNYDYLHLTNIINDGIYVTYGICCCRHCSGLVNDILQTLGFDSSLLYIFIDENGLWHKLSKPSNANHIVVLLKNNKQQYLLDPMNNFTLEIKKNGNLTPIDLNIHNYDKQLFLNYYDENINKMGKILNKYYNLKNLGINHIYNYDK
jgi:hypothetical protein